MVTIPRTNPRGRKRTRVRIEQLIRININELVTSNPAAKRIGDILFVADGEQIEIYVNKQFWRAFPLADVCCPWNRSKVYFYAVDNGRRYRALYLDPVRKMIGSRRSLNAHYSSESLAGTKWQTWWRENGKRLRKRTRNTTVLTIRAEHQPAKTHRKSACQR